MIDVKRVWDELRPVKRPYVPTAATVVPSYERCRNGLRSLRRYLLLLSRKGIGAGGRAARLRKANGPLSEGRRGRADETGAGERITP